MRHEFSHAASQARRRRAATSVGRQGGARSPRPMGQPICDFRRRNPQSWLYVNSGFRPECAKHWSFRDSFSAQAFRGAVPRVGTRFRRAVRPSLAD